MTATGRITTNQLSQGALLVTGQDGGPTSRKTGPVRRVLEISSGLERQTNAKAARVYVVTFTDGKVFNAAPAQTWTLAKDGTVADNEVTESATPAKAPADKVTKALRQGPAKEAHELAVRERATKAPAKATAKKPSRPAVKPADRKINYTRTYAGPKRSIVNHIREAFAAEKRGAFLSAGQIAKFTSKEYGSAQPSAGAVSAALHGSKLLDFVKVGTGGARGSFGAKKS